MLIRVDCIPDISFYTRKLVADASCVNIVGLHVAAGGVVHVEMILMIVGAAVQCYSIILFV